MHSDSTHSVHFVVLAKCLLVDGVNASLVLCDKVVCWLALVHHTQNVFTGLVVASAHKKPAFVEASLGHQL